MDTLKTTLNIKVIFEGPRIKQTEKEKFSDQKKENVHESDDDVAEKPVEQKKQQKQLNQELRDAKIQLIEQFPINQCLNYNVIGRYKPIILQRLLQYLQEITNMSFQGQKISIQLPKPKMHMDCGNYPLKGNILIRGTEYMQDQVMTIVAKKRGEVDLAPIPGMEARIEKMEKQRLKTIVKRKQEGKSQLPPDEKVEESIEKRVQQKSRSLLRQKVRFETHNQKNQPNKSSTKRPSQTPTIGQTLNPSKPQRPKSPPMDPLLKLKGHLQYIKGGISKFHSFIFSDVKQMHFPEEEYNFQVERLEKLSQLKDEVKQLREEARQLREEAKKRKKEAQQKQDTVEEYSPKKKYNSKQKQEVVEEYSPKRGRVVHYDKEEGYELNEEENFGDEDVKGKEKKEQDNEGKQPGRRSNERRIGNVVDKVVEWTRWASNHRQRWSQLRPYQSYKYQTALSLQQAALIVDVPKKTLDDYLFHIQFGHQNRFNFNEHCMDRFAVLRMFVNKYKREGKVNPVVVEEAKARKQAKKRYAKIRKANQKKSNRG